MLTYNYWQNVKFKDNYDQFITMRDVICKDRTVIINLNFAENNMHGCSFHCNFCIFNKFNYNVYKYPSDDDLQEFLLKFARKNGTVHIAGAGDPLFNFEKNKDKFKHLTDIILSTGRDILLTTKDIDTVYDYYLSDYLKGIDKYSFSVEACKNKIKELILKLLDEDKQVRITKVLNMDSDANSIDMDKIKKFIDFYNIENKNFKLAFRVNYLHFLKIEEIRKIKSDLITYASSTNNKVNIQVIGNGDGFIMPQLTGSEVTNCPDLEDQVIYELGINTKDYPDFFKDFKSNIDTFK